RSKRDWSSDVCSSDLVAVLTASRPGGSDAAVERTVQVEWCPRRRTLLECYHFLRRSGRRSHAPLEKASRVARPSGRSGPLDELQIGRASCRGRGGRWV